MGSPDPDRPDEGAEAPETAEEAPAPEKDVRDYPDKQARPGDRSGYQKKEG